MKGRRPRPEELELWSEVARSTRRLGRRERRRDPAPAAAPPSQEAGAASWPPAPPADPGGETLRPFRLGEAARSGRSSTAMPAAPPAPAPKMDARAHARLKRGKLRPEARIDLHGMTLDEAHPALIGFILTARSRGLRLVLVITGKGALHAPHDPAPQRRGVLRAQVPHWLRLPPLGPVVLDVVPAHLRHGGSGALYVYLRRPG
ncbi:Smr/MutS family protein [Roseivivax sp. CAU 1761]